LEQGVELDPKPLAFKVNVAPGARKIVAGEPKINQSSSTATVPVSIFIADKVVRCLEVSFRMMRKTKVVVATKALETGAVLTEADLKLEDLPADPNLRDPVVDPTTLVGKKLLRQAIAGKPVTSSMVKTQEAITARDTVNVESVVGGVKVSVRGVARTSGAVGETIRVLLTDGRKEVSGVIVDGSTVRLEGQP
jgi:flagella basal body P-ring formation protein FlgA